MRYGYFDDKAREYVIDRPDTPAPWVNYLGSPAYGAIISNNAGGYSFERSGANGRVLRYVFNQFDQPGRYIYLRDDASGDFWSASWQPVAKDLKDYQVKCCHGMGYTRMEASYAGISSQAVYYVPQGKAYEVWALTVTNNSDRDRSLTLTGYAEFTNHSNYEQDQVNLQYSLFIGRTVFEGNRITQQIHGNLDALAQGEDVDDKTVTERFFGLAGAPVSSYCGDKTAFLGAYHGYGNPQGVAAGDLGNVESYNENSCGALSCKVKLAPGESKTILFATGMKPSAEAAAILAGYADPAARVQQEVDALKTEWYSRFSHLQVNTPDPAFNTMLNTWNAYNCFITFIWSRAASLIYCGLRNGYGYRDTVQDIQGIIHLEPEMACEKIRFMLSAQVDNGGGLPLVKFTHNPGHEDTPDDPSYVKETGHPAYRADDALWLFPTVYKYVAMKRNDRVKLFVFSDGVTKVFQSGQGQTNFPSLLQFLEQISCGGKTDLLRAAVQSIPRPKEGICYVFSDGFSQDDPAKALQRLSHARQKLHLVQVLTPEEAAPKMLGDFRLTDRETEAFLDLSIDAVLLESYSQALRQFQGALRQSCEKSGGRFVSMTTQKEYCAWMQAIIG